MWPEPAGNSAGNFYKKPGLEEETQLIMSKFNSINTWLFLITLFFSLSVPAAEIQGPKVGEKPPLLEAAELLQAPPGTKFNAESLRGKVVVLEFWATWCGPCVAAIPHLNELAERFKNKPVQFVAITAEDKATVEKFLAKRPIQAWVALDTNQAMNKAYRIQAIPHTVVLGKAGRIAAITYPTMLTANHINDLLAGKTISLPGPASGTMITAGIVPGEKAKARPVFQVLIQPSSYTNSQGAVWGNGNMTVSGCTVNDILPMIYGVSPDRIITNAPLPEGRFDFVVTQPWPPKAGADADALMQEAVRSAFGLTAKRETNQLSALVLKVKDTNAPDLRASPTRGMSSRTGLASMEGVGVSIAAVATFLENALKIPVVDETGLTNRYGYDVSLKWKQESWDKPNLEGLEKAVQGQLGLELLPEQRPVELLVIEQAEKGGN